MLFLLNQKIKAFVLKLVRDIREINYGNEN